MSQKVVYLDSSAIVKLVVVEEHARALRDWLANKPNRATSALARTEVVRAVRMLGPAMIVTARAVLLDLDQIALVPRTLDAAATLDPALLRSLDAIHLATALTLGDDLSVIVSYDQRMLEGARTLGLPAASPT